MYTMNSEIATTILNQLGGSSRLKLMVGAHTFVRDDEEGFVRFDIKVAAKKAIKKIYVYYNESQDLYEMKFTKNVTPRSLDKYFADPDSFTVAKIDGLFFDQLIPTFEETTGAYLSL